jgi:CubicO group peptidase (beta-lactamase class C family)
VVSRRVVSIGCIATIVACGGQPPCPIAKAAPPPAVLRSGFATTTVEQAGFDRAAVATLLEHARASQTDALIVLRDGRLVIEDYFGGKPTAIYAMSASKSIAALAIAMLMKADPKLLLEEPVSATFAAWKSDAMKAHVTIRQLLNHTSGIAVDRAKFWRGQSTEDIVTAAPMRYEPGDDFRYNNAAVDFLSVLVFAKTDREWRLDDLLQREVFGPISVQGARWVKDTYGHPMAAGELEIEPLELAKLGQLMLQDGMWGGRRILPEGWVAESTHPSQHFREDCGLLWWLDAPMEVYVTEELLAQWRRVAAPAAVVSKAAPFIGKPFSSWKELRAAMGLTPQEQDELKKSLSPYRMESVRVRLTGPVRAYMANGWLGQYLVVIPSSRIVAVRMHTRRGEEPGDETVEYGGFVTDLRALTGDHRP